MMASINMNVLYSATVFQHENILCYLCCVHASLDSVIADSVP